MKFEIVITRRDGEMRRLTVESGFQLKVAPGDQLSLPNLAVDRIDLIKDGVNVILELPDHSQLVLVNFVIALSSDDPPTISLPRGVEVDSYSLVRQAVTETGQSYADISPSAGEVGDDRHYGILPVDQGQLIFGEIVPDPLSVAESLLLNGAPNILIESRLTDIAPEQIVIASVELVAVPDVTPPAPPQITGILDRNSLNVSSRYTNSTFLTVAGTTEPNARVQVFADGAFAGEAQADANGNWQLTTGPFTDGPHEFSAQATDTAGNVGQRSGDYSTIVDTVAPDPITLDLVTASDSGFSNIDDLTNVARPEFSGDGAEAFATVQLFDGNPATGARSLGFATVDAAGNWTFTSTIALSDAAHEIYARVMDRAGNYTDTILNVTVDTTVVANAPDLTAASDHGLLNADNITNEVRPQFAGIVERGATVEVFEGDPRAGGVSLGFATVDAVGNWTFTTPADFTEATHQIYTRVVDLAGNQAVSAPLSVSIDVTPPTATTIDLTAASDSGGSTTDNLTNVTRPQLSGGGVEANATVEIFDGDPAAGGVSLGFATVGATGNWTFTPANPLTDANHQIFARVTDLAGNRTDSTALPVTIDTTAPTFTNLNATRTVAAGTIAVLLDTDGSVRGTFANAALSDQVGGQASTNYAGYSLSVALNGGDNNDILSLLTFNSTFSVVGTTLQRGGITFANVTTNGQHGFRIDFTDAFGLVPNAALVSDVLNSIAYRYDSTVTPAGVRSVDYTITDLAGNTTTTHQDLTVGNFQRFTARTIAGDLGRSQDVQFIDLNGDGRLDIYVANDTNGGSSGQNALWLQRADGGFQAANITGDTGNSREVSFGDVDGDGDVDIFVANQGSNFNRLWTNNSGNLTDQSLLNSGGPPTLQASNVLESTFGDIDGDGDLDMFVSYGVSFGPGGVGGTRLWLNDGTGHYSQVAQVELNITSRGIVLNGGSFTFNPSFSSATARTTLLFDTDKDGALDVLALDDQGSFIWHNDHRVDGTSGLSEYTQIQIATTTGTLVNNFGTGLAGAIGDFDNDGRLDAVVTTLNSSNGGIPGVMLLHNNLNGTFTASQVPIANASSAQYLGIQAVDYDADGDLDLYVSAFTNGAQSQLLRNDGNATFTAVDNIPTDTLPVTRSTWVDIDYDGDLDFYTADYGFNSPTGVTGNQNVIWYNNINPDAGTWLALTFQAPNGALTLNGATVDLFDTDGTRVATRQYDGFSPLLFNGLDASKVYNVTITYFSSTDGKVVVGSKMGLHGATVANDDYGNLHTAEINGNVVLAAGADWTGDRSFNGTGYRDVFVSGAGNDTFQGNGGQDIYRYNAGSNISSSIKDTITDFKAGPGGDQIDIRGLLTGYNGDGSLDDLTRNGYVQLQETSGNTTILVDTDGNTGGANALAVVVLQNVARDALDDSNVHAA